MTRTRNLGNLAVNITSTGASNTITVTGNVNITNASVQAGIVFPNGTFQSSAGLTTFIPDVSTSNSISSPLVWNSNSYDQYSINAQAENLTFNADAGAPQDGQKILFRIKDNGSTRTLTWTTVGSKSFRVVGVTLPTNTTANKTIYVGCIYNANADTWDVIAVGSEA
jgi:hypothetical protein